MVKLTYANVEQVRGGDRLIIGDGVGKVERDMKYTGGYKCFGMSLRYILENYDNVEWVSYAR